MIKRALNLFFAFVPLALSAYLDNPPSPAPGKIDAYYENTAEKTTSPAGPRVRCPKDFYLTADFIYWRADEEGLGFSSSGWRADPIGVSVTPGKVTHPGFDFDPGFKAGIGFNLDHDMWDVFFQYTWFYTGDQKGSVFAETTADPALAALWFPQGAAPLSPDNPLLSEARGRWKLHFSVIDFELGRNFFVGQWMTMRPFMGFKGTWQEQDFSIRYRRFVDLFQHFQWRVTQDLDFWGFGPRAGFNTNWFFSKPVSIFGNFALTALWSHFDAERKDRFANLATPALPETTSLHTENEFHTITPVMEIALGLRAQGFIRDERYHVLFQAGWELQYFWDMNQFYRVFEPVAHGNLSLTGLTVRFRIDF